MADTGNDKKIRINLEEFMDKHMEGVIVEQIREAISFKDPTRIYQFYLDYLQLPVEVKNELLRLGDFQYFSKEFSNVVKKVILKTDKDFFDKVKDVNFKVRFRNFLYDKSKNSFPNLKKIRELNSGLMGDYVCYRGIIRNIITSKAKLKKQQFYCEECDIVLTLDFNDYGRESGGFDGKKCPTCDNQYLEILPTVGGTVDNQTLVIEELTNDSDSDTASVNTLIENDLVNQFSLGDTVIVTGNVRLDVYNEEVINQYKKKTADMRVYSYLSIYGGPVNGIEFDWFVESNMVEKISDSNIMFNEITKEEIKQIKKMSTDHHLIDKMVQSFAPDIYGHDIVKEALLYQMVGGNGRSIDPQLNKRGEIHIFLIGDPSTAKSDLLEWALGIAYKSKFIQGGNMSKAGLTGGAEQTPGGKWTLTAGVASMCDLGTIGIDEMNDIPADILQSLKEIMERQSTTTVKIRSGSFNARVSVIGSANPPKGSRYNKHKSFWDNIGINFSLFSRFDFVALFRDIPNPEFDAPIIDKIINSYEKKNIAPISREMLAKYVFFMKNQPNIPQLSQEAKDRISAFFLKIRTLDMNENVKNLGEQEQVSITHRQIQSLLRFSYARARLLGKKEVDASDIEAAERIVTHMLNSIGIDPETGKVDAGILMGMKPVSEMNRDQILFKLLEDMCRSFGNKVGYDNFINELRKRPKWGTDDIDDNKLDKYMDKLINQQNIIILNGKISLVNFEHVRKN